MYHIEKSEVLTFIYGWLAGEEPHTGIIAGVTAGYPTIVTNVEDEMLEFEVGYCRGCYCHLSILT